MPVSRPNPRDGMGTNQATSIENRAGLRSSMRLGSQIREKLRVVFFIASDRSSKGRTDGPETAPQEPRSKARFFEFDPCTSNRFIAASLPFGNAGFQSIRLRFFRLSLYRILRDRWILDGISEKSFISSVVRYSRFV
jgi:hypothetical protein